MSTYRMVPLRYSSSHLPFMSVWLLLLLAVPCLLQAQGIESVRTGARVRVSLEGPHHPRVTGALLARDDDSLRVRPDTGLSVKAIALEHVRGLEVSAGRKSSAGSGALIGFLVGAPAGVISGATCDCGNRAGAVVVLGAITGGLGAGLGAIIGAVEKHDVWRVVPLPGPRGQVADGIQVSARMRVRLGP
jgi:hypothetical protein